MEECPNDPEYIKKKTKELRIFFQNANLPDEVIDRAIENELRPLKEGKCPYIAASCPGPVKSEYEVMTGQPFTTVEDHSRPLTADEIKTMIKDSPIIQEKAKQIQILSTSDDRKEIAVPIGDVHLAGYSEIRKELDSAEGDLKAMNKINCKHMQSLVTSLNNYQAKCANNNQDIQVETDSNELDKEDEEFEAIEKEVSKYTEKSYETRFEETKEMLKKMADTFDDPSQSNDVEIKPDSILKQSSVHLIRDKKRRTVIQEVKETYSINEAINIPLVDNPVKPDFSGIVKSDILEKIERKIEDVVNVEEVFPKSMKAKLQETERALREINSVLTVSPTPQDNKTTLELNKTTSEPGEEKDRKNTDTITNLVDNQQQNQQINAQQNQQIFDERMEQTLHSALENIFEISNNENNDNTEMEFKEMKNLARTIVEGAENLSTLIREDITNKLNSMNELLNDVNTALENSRKSNVAYQQMQAEGQKIRGEQESDSVTITEITDEKVKTEGEVQDNRVTDSQIDDIHTAIGQLNSEIKCHEERINQSKAKYEETNKDCKTFIQEVDKILQKSHDILHPVKESTKELCNSLEEIADVDIPKDTGPKLNEKGEKVRKELWDIDLEKDKDKKLDEFKRQQIERNKRINSLLVDIKDKMKDNKDVLRLANNMLRREENKKKVDDNRNIEEIPDDKAQGDHATPGQNEENNDAMPSAASADGEGKGKRA